MNRQKIIRSAEKLVARGRLQAAIDEYRKVLSETPNDTSTLNRLGDLYARLDRIDKAIELFNRTAGHFVREGFFVKAIAIYKKIIRLDPVQIEVYESLAGLYHRQGLINEARSQYQVVADYYRKHERLPEAVSVHRKMIDLEPENPSHRLGLAELYRKQGLTGEALGQYREIASLMLGHGKADEATRVLLSALEVDAEDLGFITEAVLELKSSGHPRAANRLLRAAIERNPAAGELAELAAPEEDAEPGGPAAEPPEPSGPPPAGPPAAEVEGEDILVLDLDDGELSSDYAATALELLGEAEPRLEVPEIEPAEPEIEIELEEPDVPGRPEAEVEAGEAAEGRLAELVSEAEVLAKFGLEDKAAERLEEALEAGSADLAVYQRLIGLYLAGGQEARASELSLKAAELAAESGEESAWEAVSADLASRGLEPPAEAGPPPPAAPPPEAPEPSERPAAEDLDWLEEEAEGESDEPSEGLFAEEDEFFDLASELEEELRREEERLGEMIIPDVKEQSIEEIVEGFKKGMAETLSPEDYDTHYNLGIAYREMGLVDEAIGEFQLASKDPRYLVDCCSLLAASFLEKGFPELAIKWFQRGLDSPTLSESEMLGLLYELGNLFLSIGENGKARERFVEIYGINSNYRDIVARLEDLKSGS